MPFKLKNKEIKKVVGKRKLKNFDPVKRDEEKTAKRKFKVYPSAYANMWASRYKC